jgi:NDP-sugar pyrophosphorylase family protein
MKYKIKHHLNMQILIPMAGLGSRFSQSGYKEPKPFIKFLGKTMIEHVIENFGYDHQFALVMNLQHHANYNHIIKRVEQHLSHPIKISVVDSTTQGPADSCLRAENLINSSEPLVIANCDQIFDWNLSEIEYIRTSRSDLDGLILTFTAPNNPQSYSYAAVDDNCIVTHTAEKQVISPHATTGIYIWFKAADFFNSTRSMMKANDRTNGEFYVSVAYNYAIQQGRRFALYQPKYHIPIGTPRDLETYIQAQATP